MIMNKKFSTLVAGALLAGAVLTPSELLAQLQYAGGKSYETVALETMGNNKTGYLIIQDAEGKDYVASVEGNALVVTPFLKATDANKIKLTKSSESTNTVPWTLATGANMLGISGSPYNDFGSTTTLSNIVQTNGKVTIINCTAAIVLNGTSCEFGWENSGSVKDFAAKFVKASALEAIVNDRDYATSLNESSYYVLMVANKAIQLDEEGNPVLAEFDSKNQDNYWSVDVIERGEKNAYALLKNKETGKSLIIDGKEAAVKLEWDDDTEKYTLDNFSAMKLINIVDASELKLDIDGVEFSEFALCDVEEMTLSAEKLKTIFGESFNAEIKHGDKTLDKNPFVGNLKPVQLRKSGGNYTTTVVEAIGKEFMIQNGNGNIIAMQLTDKYANANSNTYGFKLVEVTPRNLALDLNQAANKRIYAPIFSIDALESFAVGKDQEVLRIRVKELDGTGSYELGCLELSSKHTLSAEMNSTQFLDKLTIKLGKFNTVDVKKLLSEPTFFTVTNKNTKATHSPNYGKVLSVNTNGNAGWVKAADALVGYPQSQWAITVNEDASVLTFKNRENPDVVESRYYDEENDELVSSYFTINASDLYNIKGETNVFAWGNDTIEIKPVATKESDGFLRLSNYKNEMYHVGVVSSVWDGVAYVAENHKEAHQLGLTTDVEAATNWKLAPAMYKEWNSLNEVIENRPDTLLIGSTLSYWSADDNKFVNTDKDGKQTVFLKVLAYSMLNNATKEYVMFDGAEGDGHYSTGTKDGGNEYSNYYAFKQVGTEKYNIVEVYGNQEERYIGGSKMYGGDSADKGILNRTNKYDQTENDIFTIEVADAAEYLKLNMGDVIKIFRNEFESNVLYEKGEFAGIGDEVEFGKINPALYVDTAYVDREGNNRWDYLLGVDITRIDTTYQCNVPAHGVHHMDTTYGRFLVNLADSAIVEDTRDNHSNKFVYEDNYTRYAKLGFVEGMHTNDTLVIASTKDSIAVGAPEYSLAKFAFRIVDHSKNTFVIETGYKYPQDYEGNKVQEYPGYLRWINGNLVVTDDVEDAEVFTLKNDDRTPTANDEIAASEISVIAGNGVVTVKGAEGKKVVITNVLGQTIASTVITSSEATIATPAGYVTVAVGGEAAVKAIVI